MTVWSAFTASYAAQADRPATPRPRRVSVVLTVVAAVWGTIAGIGVRRLRQLRRVALTVSGLACLVSGAFTLGLGWGLAATGVALLTLEALSGDGQVP